jgi:hypothetical protein
MFHIFAVATLNHDDGLQNSVTGPGTSDQFEEKGFVTPDQFVAAGDMLVSKCRTWTW